MPELPEVETIRRGLESHIIGKTIEAIDISLPRIFRGDPSLVINRKISAVRRFGKGLVIELERNMSIAAHVKMTGQFVFQGKKTHASFHPILGVAGKLPNKWTHVIFSFSDGSRLFYNDIRQFGWLHVLQTEAVKEHTFFKNLGKEPFVSLTEENFKDLLLNSKAPIKSLLMNQQKIAGIGNIYASEALFVAGIHPQRVSSSLTSKESTVLFHAILEVLQKGLDHKGASETNFIHVDGSTGTYQNHFLVYGRVGKPCVRCSTPLVRVVIAGRSSFFCPSCQQ